MSTYFEKILHKKRASGVAQGVGPEFKPQHHKKEKKKKSAGLTHPILLRCSRRHLNLRGLLPLPLVSLFSPVSLSSFTILPWNLALFSPLLCLTPP
jgi:hypothetical protein